MSYRYEDLKPGVLTDDGQRKLLELVETARSLFRTAGAATFGKLTAGITGDSWTTIAFVDRLIELARIRCVNPGAAREDQVYVPDGRWS